MGFQPSALHRDQHLARAANLARIKPAVASERSQRPAGKGRARSQESPTARAAPPPRSPHELLLGAGRRGNRSARLYHAAGSDPAAGASLPCLDPARRRCQPAEGLPALPALAAIPRWRSDGLFPRGTEQTKETPRSLRAHAKGHVSLTSPHPGARSLGKRYPTSCTGTAAGLVEATCAKHGKEKKKTTLFSFKKINFVIFRTFANYSSAFLMKVLCWAPGDQGTFC